jgi:hypothetical protein
MCSKCDISSVHREQLIEGRHFLTCFCRQYMMVFMIQNSHFSLVKLKFHLSGYVNAQNTRY